MKKLWTVVVVIGLFGFLMGCATGKSLDSFSGGGGGGSSQMASGNWDIEATSGTAYALGFGGNLTVSGSTVSGNLLPYSGDGCYTPSNTSTSVSVNSTISSGSLPLSIVAGSTTFTITLTVPSGTSPATTLTGTYTATGGCEDGLSGNISANLVSGTLGGTWSGTDSVTASVLAFNFSVASTATTSGNLLGTYAITASSVTLTPTSSGSCPVTGVSLNADSFAAGKLLFLDVSETEGGIPSEFVVYGTVDSATSPSSFNGAYGYLSGGNCLLNVGGNTFTMTKQ